MGIASQIKEADESRICRINPSLVEDLGQEGSRKTRVFPVDYFNRIKSLMWVRLQIIWPDKMIESFNVGPTNSTLWKIPPAESPWRRPRGPFTELSLGIGPSNQDSL